MTMMTASWHVKDAATRPEPLLKIAGSVSAVPDRCLFAL